MDRASEKTKTSEEFGKDLGLIHELVVTGRKVGFRKEDYVRLTHDERFLKKILGCIREEYKIVAPIDTDIAPPQIPGTKLEKHIGIGTILFSQESVSVDSVFELPTSKTYLGAPIIYGFWEQFLDKEKTFNNNGRRFLNASVLDYLMKNQELIPEEWKDKKVFFWGTLYGRVLTKEYENMEVRYLIYDGEWKIYLERLSNYYGHYGPDGSRGSAVAAVYITSKA
jgi:hypothetical protein